MCRHSRLSNLADQCHTVISVCPRPLALKKISISREQFTLPNFSSTGGLRQQEFEKRLAYQEDKNRLRVLHVRERPVEGDGAAVGHPQAFAAEGEPGQGPEEGGEDSLDMAIREQREGLVGLVELRELGQNGSIERCARSQNLERLASQLRPHRQRQNAQAGRSHGWERLPAGRGLRSHHHSRLSRAGKQTIDASNLCAVPRIWQLLTQFGLRSEGASRASRTATSRHQRRPSGAMAGDAQEWHHEPRRGSSQSSGSALQLSGTFSPPDCNRLHDGPPAVKRHRGCRHRWRDGPVGAITFLQLSPRPSPLFPAPSPAPSAPNPHSPVPTKFLHML